MDNLNDLRYPIGLFEPQPYSDKQKEQWLLDIHFLPQELEIAVQTLDAAQLDTPYRPGGWNLKQLVHHVADSHMNGYIRTKLALTEDNPTIKPYDENAWAALPDVDTIPINVSLTLLHALHKRWHTILSHIQPGQWQREVFHPQHKKSMTLWYILGQYAWHGRHHTAHINRLKERMGW
jgi:hypothetical protein